jgi:hypothetical protein
VPVLPAGGKHAVYAGKEVARALAKDSLAVEDCNADLSDCSKEELQRFEQQLQHIQATYDEVGKVSMAHWVVAAVAAVMVC